MEDVTEAGNAEEESYEFEQARRPTGQYGRVGEPDARAEVVSRSRARAAAQRRSRKRTRSGQGIGADEEGEEMEAEDGVGRFGAGDDEEERAPPPSDGSSDDDGGDEEGSVAEVEDGGADDDAWCGGDFEGGGEPVLPEDDEVLPQDAPGHEPARSVHFPLFRRARAVISMDAGRLPRLSFQSAIRAADTIWKRSVAMTELIVWRLRTGVVVAPDGWVRVGGRRLELLARVVGLVLCSWTWWGDQIVGGRMNGVRAMNVTLRLTSWISIAPAPSPGRARELLSELAFLAGLGGWNELSAYYWESVVAGEGRISTAGVDPAVQSVVSVARSEDPSVLHSMCKGPFLTLPTSPTTAWAGLSERGTVEAIHAVIAATDATRADQPPVELRDDLVWDMKEYMGTRSWRESGARRATERETWASHLSSGALLRGEHRVVRIPLEAFPGDFWAGGHHIEHRFKLAGDDGAAEHRGASPVIEWLQALLSPEDFSAVASAAVNGWLVRVSEGYEDSVRAARAHAALRGVRQALKKAGIDTIPWPLSITSDGVAVSIGDGATVTPTMAMPMCGSSWRFWSATNSSVTGFSVKGRLRGLSAAGEVERRREAQSAVRDAIECVAVDLRRIHCVAEALEVGGSDEIDNDDGNVVLLVDEATGGVILPIPYIAAMHMDQVEMCTLCGMSRLGSEPGHECRKCSQAENPPFGEFVAYATSLLEHEAISRGLPVMSSDEVRDTLMVDAGEASATAFAVEQALAANPRAAKEAERIHLRPVVSVDVFASMNIVARRAAAALDVTLRDARDVSDGGAQLYVPDPMHLLVLAMKHALKVLDANFKDDKPLRDSYAALWQATGCVGERGGATTTYGLCGLHRNMTTTLIEGRSEAERYAQFLRASLVSSMLGAVPGNVWLAKYTTTVLLPLCEVILTFYAPHRRHSAALESLPRCVEATLHAWLFAAGYEAAARNTVKKQASRNKINLSHHHLVHMISGWLRFGSAALTSMSGPEHHHRTTRAAAQRTSKQTTETDSSIPRLLTERVHHLALAERVAMPLVDPGTERSERELGLEYCMRRIERKGRHGIPRRAVAAPEVPVLRALVRSLLDADIQSRQEYADGDVDAVLATDAFVAGAEVLDRVPLPLHSYIVTITGFSVRPDSPESVVVGARCVSTNDADACSASTSPRMMLVGMAIYSSLCGRPVTLLLGHLLDVSLLSASAPAGDSDSDGLGFHYVAHISVPPAPSLDSACFLGDVDVSFGSVWDRRGSRLVLSRPIHPTFLALRRSKVKV
jgi:hypothetical protein